MDAQTRKSVKAIIPVHLYGQCADMEAILKISREYNIPVIEDGAQAIGAECEIDGQKRSAGSSGEFGCFSFFPSKNLGGVGDGGIVTINNSEMADQLQEELRHLRRTMMEKNDQPEDSHPCGRPMRYNSMKLPKNRYSMAPNTRNGPNGIPT